MPKASNQLAPTQIENPFEMPDWHDPRGIRAGRTGFANLKPPLSGSKAPSARFDCCSRSCAFQVFQQTANPHVLADNIICDLLEALGYGDVVLQFRKIHEAYPVVTS